MCELFFNCINEQAVDPTGLFYFVVFLLAFSTASLGMVGGERRASPDDVPTPLVVLLASSLMVALGTISLLYLIEFFFANKLIEFLVGAITAVVAAAIIIIAVFIRRYRWK